jgi:hypothetical protein
MDGGARPGSGAAEDRSAAIARLRLPGAGASPVHSSGNSVALPRSFGNTYPGGVARGREMRKQDLGFDYHRYRQLLAEAVDEKKRLALIDLLIEERAMDRLEAQRASDRAAMTAATIATVLRARA